MNMNGRKSRESEGKRSTNEGNSAKRVSEKELNEGENPSGGMKRMTNGFRVRLFFERYLQHEQNTVFALLVGVVLTFLYYEYDYGNKDDSQSQLLLMLISATTCVSVVLLVLKHHTYNEWKKAELQENQMKSIFSLLTVIVVVLIQPYPFINDHTFVLANNLTHYQVNYKVNYLLVLCSMLRFLIIIPIFFITSKFLTPRSVRICKMYGSDPSFLYTIKCMFKELPIRMVAGWFVFSIILFSFTYRVSERGIAKPGTSNPFDYYANTVWLTIITMTTVGYGDMAPASHVGRMVGLLCVVWGGFLVGVMVVVLTNTFNLDQRQKRTLVILKRLELRQQIKEVAGKFVSKALTRTWLNYKNFKDGTNLDCIHQDLAERKLKACFRTLRRKSKMNLMDIDLKEDMTRHFERIDAHLQNLKKKSDNLIDFINEEYFIGRRF